MRKFSTVVLSAVVALCGGSAITPAHAAPSFALQLGSPVFCFGFDEDTNQCLLYLGDEETCASLTPCLESPFGSTLPNKFKVVGSRKPGKCELVFDLEDAAASSKPNRQDRLCRLEIRRE